MKVTGFGIYPLAYTASNLPACDTPVIKKLAGNPDKGEYGLAYDHFKELDREEEGIETCKALDNWVKFKQIETLLSTFICPL
jgi:hypothetical protein